MVFSGCLLQYRYRRTCLSPDITWSHPRTSSFPCTQHHSMVICERVINDVNPSTRVKLFGMLIPLYFLLAATSPGRRTICHTSDIQYPLNLFPIALCSPFPPLLFPEAIHAKCGFCFTPFTHLTQRVFRFISFCAAAFPRITSRFKNYQCPAKTSCVGGPTPAELPSASGEKTATSRLKMCGQPVAS